MAIEKVRRLGPYAPLSAQYYEDDAIVEAGEKAELLYLRGLAFCANHATDGFITTAQINRFVGSGMDDISNRVDALIATNLWVQVPGGIVIRAWLKWNKSAKELGYELAKDRDRKRQQTLTTENSAVEQQEQASEVELFEAEQDSARNPDGILEESALIPPITITSLHFTNTNTKNTSPSSSTPENENIDDLLPGMPLKPVKPQKGQRTKLSEEDPDFAKFWTLYPRPVDKINARRAWANRIRDGCSAAEIIAGAERYHETAKLETTITFIPYPSTWLNGERWKDEPIATRWQGRQETVKRPMREW